MAEKDVKIFRRSEIKKNDENKRIRVIIHNNVYDVTDFLNEPQQFVFNRPQVSEQIYEHPGGEEVLLEQAGEDGTVAFEDVSHSLDARSLMQKYKIGELHESDKVKTQEKIMKDWADKKDEHGSWKSWMIPVTLAVLATLIYRFYFHH